MVQQLVHRQTVFSDEVKRLYQLHIKQNTRPEYLEYSQLFQSVAASFSKIYVVIDALDECDEHNKTRGSLIRDIKSSMQNVHLLCTSRPHVHDIRNTFPDALHVDIRANDDDMRKYLEAQTEKEDQLQKHFRKDPNLRTSIIETIMQKAQEMHVPLRELSEPFADLVFRFLLAQLQFRSLAGKLTVKAVRRALETLPEELDDIYRRALERICLQSKEKSKLAQRVG